MADVPAARSPTRSIRMFGDRKKNRGRCVSILQYPTVQVMTSRLGTRPETPLKLLSHTLLLSKPVDSIPVFHPKVISAHVQGHIAHA